MRVFVQDADDFVLVAKMLLLLLIPLAVAMIVEKATGRNIFALLGGFPELSEMREGKVRARGPFGHPILAGTAGAVCLPLAILFWHRNRTLAVAGLAAAAAIVFATASSGPVLTTVCTLGALGLWKFRHYLRSIRWTAILVILGLQFVMNDPVYYLMARIDLVGGSTGWHRARLIEAAINHLQEWWFAGTDYTRHWMPTGIQANEVHTDITNYYIVMGVIGGLPLMLLFIWVLLAAFRAVGRALQSYQDEPTGQQFLMWTLGAILFGHAVTFMSIPYFDQTVVFLYLLLASIGSLQAIQSTPDPLVAGNAALPDPLVAGDAAWSSAEHRLNRWQQNRLVA